MRLNKQQAYAISRLNAGANVFLTGPAGVGKSFLLNEWMRQRGRTGVAVTASTGIAATHIGGVTVHRWSGCGIGKVTPGYLESKRWWRMGVKPIIVATNTLIIDEISMLDGKMFGLIDQIARRAKRERDLSFGGIQVVLVGDMGQLAPVESDKGFAFESPSWAEANLEIIELTEVMRQTDKAFIECLLRVRDGLLTEDDGKMLSARLKAYDPDESGAVRLMTHNKQVDPVNDIRLGQLPGRETIFWSNDEGKEKDLELLDKACLSPRNLAIKVGARVMFTKNDKGGAWQNGSLGTVEGWKDKGNFHDRLIRVKLDNGSVRDVFRETWKISRLNKKGVEVEIARRTQFPLRLAWAITIHKSQGMTLEKVSVNLADTFAAGQGYVALSRAKSLEGLNIESWRGRRSFIVNSKFKNFLAT